MSTTLIMVVGVIGLWLLTVVSSVLKAVIEAEIRGVLHDRLEARVYAAAALLPREIAEDVEAEWLEELASARDRPRVASRFVRGLPQAARAIALQAEATRRIMMAGLDETASTTAPPTSTPAPAQVQVPVWADALLDDPEFRRWAVAIRALPALERYAVSAWLTGRSTREVATHLDITVAEVHGLPVVPSRLDPPSADEHPTFQPTLGTGSKLDVAPDPVDGRSSPKP
jgi:hypothetical protein